METPPNRGKVLSTNDKRLRPHSPERRAAIAAGQARSALAHAQRDLAVKGKPHLFTPWHKPPKRATAEQWERFHSFGGCWACWWAGAAVRHIQP